MMILSLLCAFIGSQFYHQQEDRGKRRRGGASSGGEKEHSSNKSTCVDGWLCSVQEKARKRTHCGRARAETENQPAVREEGEGPKP